MRKILTVDDIMTPGAVAIAKTASLGEALSLMERSGVKKLIVTGGPAPQVLERWKITEGDLKRPISSLPLSEGHKVAAGTPVAAIEDALARFPAVVVVDADGRTLKGVVTAADFAAKA